MLSVAVVVLAVAGPAAAAEGTVSVPDLHADGAAYDGAGITVEGELVGDYGFRRDGTMWTQLNDDAYARSPLVETGVRAGGNAGIGVRMPARLAEGLDPAGGYRLRGPVVRLTGTWRFHDPDRGGESYLDVTGVVVVEPGRRLEEGPDWLVFVTGLVLVSVAAVMLTSRRSA